MTTVANEYDSWTDILDHQKYEETCIAVLYRNPRLNISDNTKYEPANHLYSLDAGSNCLFDQSPVAYGFSAYIGHDEIKPGWNSLKSNLENRKLAFRTIDYFKNYFQKLFDYEYRLNCMLPYPKTEEEFERELLMQQIKTEREFLKSSRKFYSQFQNSIDQKAKENLRDYVIAYFSWLQSKLDEKEHNSSEQANIPGSVNFNDSRILNKKEITSPIQNISKDPKLEDSKTHFIKGTHALAEYLRMSPSKAQKLINLKIIIPVYREGRTILYDPVQVLKANSDFNKSKSRKK